MPKIHGSGKKFAGSKSPGIGYLFVVFIMVLAIIAGNMLSGGMHPVDPNGPGGPPTLEPYFDAADYGEQTIVFDEGSASGIAGTPGAGGAGGGSARNNLQLKTFKVNVCGQKVAVDFLIDTSGSMNDDNKIGRVQEALNAFTKKLGGKGGIAMQSFGAEVHDDVPFDYYKANKGQVQATISSLKGDGWTRTRDGFQTAYTALVDAQKDPKFAGYHFNLVLLTDGVPEIPPDQHRTCIAEFPDPRTAPANRCFAKEQDPTTDPDVAAEIKKLGISIYTIGIFSESGTDKQLQPYLENMLKTVASAPLDSHYYSTVNAANLEKVFADIVSSMCSEVTEGDQRPL